jgi:ABC-type transport system involved in multi-copper enzyme maturation permease subunit
MSVISQSKPYGLWRLERRRLFRTGRWIALAAVFVVVGFGNPLATRYLGELLRGATGGGYIQIIVTEPKPSDGMISYFGNITSLGTLVTVVVAALAFAMRANPPLAAVYLTHVPSRVKLLLPRLVTMSVATLVAALVGGGAALYATTILFGPPNTGPTLAGIAASGLGMVFAVAVTFLCATLLRGQVGAIAVALVALVMVVPTADLIPGVRRVGPNSLINLPTTLQTTPWSTDNTWATVVTLGLALACVAGGLLRATRWEL